MPAPLLPATRMPHAWPRLPGAGLGRVQRWLWRLQRKWLPGLLLGWLLSGAVQAADIYRAVTAEGEERFATHAPDASYHLFLRDETPATHLPHPPRPSDPIMAQRARALAPLITELANKHAVDAKLVQAIIEVESRFNAQARSHKGAAGLMQLMPATARQYGVTDRYDTRQNLEAGIRFLKDMLSKHQGNVALALAAYNAGTGTVGKYDQRIPPYRETMLYVPAVLLRLQLEDAAK